MVLTLFVALLSWLFPSNHKTRQAFQWWQQQQVNRLHNGAELIRDGILQELFAIRRSLELAHDEHEAVYHDSLQRLETLHLRLEQISNALSPAFIRDSLSLSIQHVLQQWQSQHPSITLSIQLPHDLREPTLASRVVFTTLEELLALIDKELDDETLLEVVLEYQDNTAILMVRVSNLNRRQSHAIAHVKELSYLHQSFQFLTNGHSTQVVHGSWIEWRFKWLVPLQTE